MRDGLFFFPPTVYGLLSRDGLLKGADGLNICRCKRGLRRERKRVIFAGVGVCAVEGSE